MKVLLINGSPHEKGCVYTDLMIIAGQLEKHGVDWELFQIGTGAVHGCASCRQCRRLGKCVYDDDPCNTLVEKFREADGIIVGSPVFYSGPNGALCALLDRVFQVDQLKNTYANKPAAAIVNCRRGGASAALDRLNRYFTMNRMHLVCSQYWNISHGMTPEQLMEDEEGLQIMRTLGDEMAWVLRSLEKAALPQPEKEPWIMTNFVRLPK